MTVWNKGSSLWPRCRAAGVRFLFVWFAHSFDSGVRLITMSSCDDDTTGFYHGARRSFETLRHGLGYEPWADGGHTTLFFSHCARALRAVCSTNLYWRSSLHVQHKDIGNHQHSTVVSSTTVLPVLRRAYGVTFDKSKR